MSQNSQQPDYKKPPKREINVHYIGSSPQHIIEYIKSLRQDSQEKQTDEQDSHDSSKKDISKIIFDESGFSSGAGG
jgi:hypothetical protein